MNEIKARNIKVGMILAFKNSLHRVLEATYAQTCQSEPSMTLKLKDVYTSKITNTHIHANDTARIEHIISKEGQFLSSNDENMGTFLNDECEVIEYSLDNVNKPELLSPNCKVFLISTEEGKLICIDLPPQIELIIESCSDSDKHKKATVARNVQITVPGYIKAGDIVRIHSDSLEFIERIRQ